MNADNLNQILDALAQRFGTTGLHLWEVLVTQQVVWGWITVCAFVLSRLFTVLLIVLEYTVNDGNWLEPFPFGIPALVGGFATFILGLVTVFSSIPMIINPEYYVLIKILPL